MMVGLWLQEAGQKLSSAGIATAELDALVLAEDVSGIDRAQILAHPLTKLSPTQIKKLNNLLSRRIKHEPLAYLRGHTEFYGREFKLTPAVLEPRPESETMIELLKKLVNEQLHEAIKTRNLTLADIGTGSGALGITAALEIPGLSVDLIDISESALEVAKTNVDLFTLSISLFKRDLLLKTPRNYTILLCNLPYVPDNFKINAAALYEPRIAIFGGPDGLDVYRRLLKQVGKLASKPLYILCEAMPPQHSQLSNIATGASYEVDCIDDFIIAFKLKQQT